MMFTTLNKIREHEPCREGWEKLLRHLGKTKADDDPLGLDVISAGAGRHSAAWPGWASGVMMTKRTHIDHLLERRGITKKQHAKLKAEEETRKHETEQDAAKIAQAVIDKARRPNVELTGAGTASG